MFLDNETNAEFILEVDFPQHSPERHSDYNAQTPWLEKDEEHHAI